MNSFMNEIRKNNQVLHDSAEKTGFLKRLMDGKASKESYAEYLFNIYEIYKTIEFNLEKYRENSVVNDFAIKKVYRTEEIYKDLKFLLGEKLSEMRLLASTKAYIERINEVSEKQPELLVAHAYSRYLADLFGGRSIYKMLRESYEIDPKGLNYYVYDEVFEDADDMRAFVMEYHGMLNEVEFDRKLEEKFINEVSNSYIYNIAISNELEIKLYNK
ncbi:heme oxygenase (biliverdin-producing) [Eubacterium multiforme]|uniref:Heme oxygenase n=1 Tax=Eubacterium multiforme TaxID=83339 RepID=A0ABT9UU64_9FIRM|nr:biliverdin-producing heme oxygenase [Eubacterium multiforme]MDQ0149871.1 heme oxygenase [Eubacterium multiforme]